jgi:hypothetical protein
VFFRKRVRPVDSADFHDDRRVHTRFSLDAGLATLVLANGRKGIVRDISYSGIAVTFPHPIEDPELAAATALGGRLEALGAGTNCRLRVVRSIARGGESFLGFGFQHSTPAALLFLRELIEPLSRGATVAPADTGTATARGGGWEWYVGDGPSEVILQREVPGGPAATAVITFRLNDLYLNVLYREGTLRTHRDAQKTIDPAAPATFERFGEGAADPRILRPAIFLLTALPGPLGEAMKPVFATALATLPLVDPQAA